MTGLFDTKDTLKPDIEAENSFRRRDRVHEKKKFLLSLIFFALFRRGLKQLTGLFDTKDTLKPETEAENITTRTGKRTTRCCFQAETRA